MSKIAGGFLADRIPHEKAILYDHGLLAVSSGVLLLLPHPTLLPVFVLSYGFSQAARDVVYPLVIERCFGARHLASIYGTMTLTLLPGAALGPLMAAALRDSLGDYRLAFTIFAVLNLMVGRSPLSSCATSACRKATRRRLPRLTSPPEPLDPAYT